MDEAERRIAMTTSTDRLRVGYSTLHDDPSGPGDRRRFCAYAARRNLQYEIARPAGRYDVVVSTVSGDLSVWSGLPRETKFVLDMVDSYLADAGTSPRAALRGLFKFAFGHTRRLHLDYRRLIEDSCRRADAVICTTEEQRESILPFCPNVHVILDFQSEVASHVKQDYGRGEVFRLVWEGLGQNVRTFRAFRDVFRTLSARHKIALHLITDLEYPRASTSHWMRPTQDLVRDLFGQGHVYLSKWNAEQLASQCTACDMAVIPIPLDAPFLRGKPENKLILFWRMGLPVVTSATPAYVRAMSRARLAMTCNSEQEWVELLERYMGDESARREAGQRGLEFAREEYSEARLTKQWDDVFDTVSAAPAGGKS
jgi:glycosyltransferase involved in cell wall biosynthesis